MVITVLPIYSVTTILFIFR